MMSTDNQLEDQVFVEKKRRFSVRNAVILVVVVLIAIVSIGYYCCEGLLGGKSVSPAAAATTSSGSTPTFTDPNASNIVNPAIITDIIDTSSTRIDNDTNQSPPDNAQYQVITENENNSSSGPIETIGSSGKGPILLDFTYKTHKATQRRIKSRFKRMKDYAKARVQIMQRCKNVRINEPTGTEFIYTLRNRTKEWFELPMKCPNGQETWVWFKSERRLYKSIDFKTGFITYKKYLRVNPGLKDCTVDFQNMFQKRIAVGTIVRYIERSNVRKIPLLFRGSTTLGPSFSYISPEVLIDKVRDDFGGEYDINYDALKVVIDNYDAAHPDQE